MKKDRELIYGLILLCLSMVIISIDLIIDAKYTELIIVDLFIMIFIGLDVSLIISDWTLPKQIRKNKKYYMKIKSKENKSSYEKLYILAYQEKDEEIIDILRLHKIKDLRDVGIYVNKVDQIDIIYRYKGFDVTIKVYETKVVYLIDTPSRYDYLEINKEFEKENIIEIEIKNINYDTLINKLIEVINTTKEKIITFTYTNVVDEVFNGRLLRKIERYKKNCKELGIIEVVFGSLIAIILLLVVLANINNPNFFGNNTEKIIGIICFSLFIAFGFFSVIHGIELIKLHISATNDFNQKRLKKIKERPKKIKIIYEDNYRRRNVRYISGIIICFDKVKLTIPFECIEGKKRDANIKLFKQKCLEIRDEITYLEKSKLIINGSKKYIKYAKEYIFL